MQICGPCLRVISHTYQSIQPQLNTLGVAEELTDAVSFMS